MERLLSGKRYWIILFILCVVSYVLAAKMMAAITLNYIGDEPDDIGIVVSDLHSASNFFHNADSPDQSRLPHVLAAPFALVWRTHTLIPLRIFNIIIYTLYLYILYKALKIKLGQTWAAAVTLLTATSAFLMSFSIMTMTSSNNLYLLFATAVLYYYLRYFESRSLSVPTRRIVILGTLAGLMIASKLFGCVVLAAIALYDLIRRRHDIGSLDVKTLWRETPIRYALYFIAGWLFANVVPLTDAVKLFIALVVAVGYVVMLINYFVTEPKDHESSSAVLPLWITAGMTAFVVTIVASPIYLNIHNMLSILNWFGNWDSPILTVHPTKYDYLLIMAVKYGWIAFVAALAGIFIAWRRKELGRLASHNILFIWLFVVHAVAFSLSSFVVAWYPLLVFPFLYVPIAYCARIALEQRSKFASYALIAFLAIVPLYEQWRWWYLFPYAQTDGLQYGVKYTGWNKPGFVTFEAMPMVQDFLASHQDKYPPGIIVCNLVFSERFNRWGMLVANNFLQSGALHDYECLDPKVANGKEPYMLTTVYSPEIQVLTNRYQVQKQFKIDGTTVATFWVKR